MTLRTDLRTAGKMTARVAIKADLSDDLRASLLDTASDLYRAATWVSDEEESG